jgi:hypothetical protein
VELHDLPPVPRTSTFISYFLTVPKGTKARLKVKFAVCRVRMPDREPLGQVRRGPAEEELWLDCEWRATGEKRCCLCNYPPDTPLQVLVRAIKARWICEKAHEQMKNDLGLDHLECRGWNALQFHTILVMMVVAFLQHLRSGGKRRGEAVWDIPPRPRYQRSDAPWPSNSEGSCTCAVHVVMSESPCDPHEPNLAE